MKKLFSLFVFSLLFTSGILAQSLSDDQVVEFVKSATAAGKPQKQIITELARKGVTRAQLERIKKQREEQQANQQSTDGTEKNRMRYSEETNPNDLEEIAISLPDTIDTIKEEVILSNVDCNALDEIETNITEYMMIEKQK